jgi:hypothetical protein
MLRIVALSGAKKLIDLGNAGDQVRKMFAATPGRVAIVMAVRFRLRRQH